MIKVPNLTFENSLYFAKDLQLVDLAEGEIFDFSSVKNCDPFPMLLVSSAIRQKRYSSEAITCRALNCSNTYATHMRFFRSTGMKLGRSLSEDYGNSNYLPFTKLEISDLRKQGLQTFDRIQVVIENKALLMANVLSNGNPSFNKLLKYIFTEILRNVPEHSKAESIWYCAQFWPKYDLVELAILDEGVGIKESLLDNPAYESMISNDSDAINLAIKPGISKAFIPGGENSSSDEWSNSGYGLYMVSRLCTKLGGSFSIASGDQAIRINRSGIKSTFNTFFNGTAIQIRISPSQIDGHEELAKHILEQGEKRAALEGGFGKASKSSKGLFEDIE